MIIGTLQIHLYLADSCSLKAKRQVIKSIKDKLRHKFNISISEVDCLDSLKEAIIGIACVSNSKQHLDRVLSKIMQGMENFTSVELIDYKSEIL